MKKIGLYLGIEPTAGGMFQYCQTILEALRALPQDEYTAVVVYTSTQWSKNLKNCGIKTVFVHTSLWESTFWKIWRAMKLSISAARNIRAYLDPLAKTLLRENSDLWIFPSQDPLAFQVPLPTLASIHDLMHRYERRFPEVSDQGIYRKREWSYRNTCRWADGVLVDSSVGKIQVMESYGQSGERIHILPYIPPKYIFSRQASDDFPSRYELPQKYIFYPAHFWEHKNHKNLISAISRLKRDVPDLKLVLVGSKKNSYDSTVKYIQNLNLTDAVMILGHVADEDMVEFYRRARALVMPTFFGPTNIPPLEAFAVGCPVAISGIYGIPEQVGDAALLFSPGSIEEIARCIRQLWVDDDLCAKLIQRGKQRAAAWGQKQFNERFHEIIEHTLKVRSSVHATMQKNYDSSMTQ